jgi:hypothetical protein
MMATESLRLRFTGMFAVIFFACCGLLHAQAAARFDLTGPKIEVHVTRAGKTLPIASVPNLQAGDKIWLHPDLPPTQSVHYLLVAVFLRGTTNPPPDDWFFRIQTWDKKVREEGVTITVPNEAQQAILFLAPETGGDFSTLRSAVRGRPGIFVRASQDLAEAGFEQARIEKYLASMQKVPPSDPKALQDHSTLLARTLNLKPNQDCFSRPVDMQFNCLTQSGTQTLLDDGHAQTIVASLTSGDTSSFINAASYTGMAGGGVYSAYVGAVVDLVHLMSGLHTAHYQYIPAIAFPNGESLNLRLNMPPSFNNPKSVIVIGLPAIQASVPPPLRPAEPKHISCLLKPAVVLPVEGAPLVFSTSFAHDLVLHVNPLHGTGPSTEIPLTADAFQGGLVLSRTAERKVLSITDDSNSPATPAPAPNTPLAPPASSTSSTVVTGTITGFWGFDPFTGPSIQLQVVPGEGWKLAPGDLLIAGRENHLSLSSTGTACIESITLDTEAGEKTATQWKLADKPNVVDVKVSVPASALGALHLSIDQHGESQIATVTAETFSEPARLTALVLHAGDTTATLTGTRLDQVQNLSLSGLDYAPAPATGGAAQSETANATLKLTLPPNAPAPKFQPGDKLIAHFTLKDGRSLDLPVTVAPPRPSITLLSKSVAQPGDSPIHLTDDNDLPVNQQLTFSLRSSTPFPRTGQIEVSNADDSLRTTLSVPAGTLVLQNPHTLLGTLDPLKTFGTSAYGPLRVRAVSPEGIAGDWLPLVTLVRLPVLKDIHCPADASQPCTLTGSNLYLIDKLAIDADFTNPTEVPEGFVGTTLAIPRPGRSGFYLRLRDDPSAANSVVMPIAPIPTTTAERKNKDAQP